MSRLRAAAVLALLLLASLPVAARSALATGPTPTPTPCPSATPRPSPHPSPCPTATPTPSPSPSPTPVYSPTLNLSAASGSPGDSVTVTGGGFPPGAALAVVWAAGAPDLQLATVTSDAKGGFSKAVALPGGAAIPLPRQGQLCAGQPPVRACADFELLAPASAATPTPAATETPGPSPSPSAPAPATATPTPIAIAAHPTGALAGLLGSPPFWILIALLLAGLGGAILLIVRGRRPAPAAAPAPAARVSHRSPGLPGQLWTAPPPPSPPAGAAAPPPPPAGPAPEGPRAVGGEGPPDLPQPGD